ncbi:MAG: hypothetical protein ACRBN8_18010 [Nannocystales bacterium]
MRRLFFVGLSCLPLACGDGTDSDDSAADASGTDTAAAMGSTGPVAPGSTSGATSSTSDTSGTTGEETGGGPPSDTSGGGDDSTGGETGGSGETGPALPRGQWAMTEITYTEGGDSETLSMQDRTFCDATLTPDGVLVRYQQAGGYTVWSVTIPTSAAAGEVALSQDFSGVYMNINEVGAAWQSYFDPSMAFGTLDLTEADVHSSGVVAGVLSATLTSNDGSTTADFSSTFYAEIP